MGLFHLFIAQLFVALGFDVLQNVRFVTLSDFGLHQFFPLTFCVAAYFCNLILDLNLLTLLY